MSASQDSCLAVASDQATVTSLWGRDHVKLGEIAIESPRLDVAIGITKGKYDKPYSHIDPNEDVVAAIAAGPSTLLICADGHNGLESSHVAVRYMLDALNDEPPSDLSEEALVDLFHGAGEAVLRTTEDPSCRNTESRTTLSLALISNHRLVWASMGDSAVIVASTEGGKTFGSPEHHYLGWPMTVAEVEERLPCGTHDLMPGEWVILATDGFTNFAGLPSPEEGVQGQLEEQPAPRISPAG